MRSRNCNGKFSYPTQREAAGARRAMFERKGSSDPTSLYPCAECGGWHIGRQRGLNAKPKRGGDRVRTKLSRYWELVRGNTPWAT